MVLLQLPVATWSVTSAQPMLASDWTEGSFLRRYRDTRALRTYTLVLQYGPGVVALAERQFEAGSLGSAVFDWVNVDGDGTSTIPVLFTALSWTPTTGVVTDITATLVECRSTD